MNDHAWEKTTVEGRCYVVWRNVRQRCESEGDPKYEYYGGRGIRCLISHEELIRLWRRDNADEMEQPSIDRRDADGHYTFENCRFREFAENRVDRVLRRHCGKCATPITKRRDGLCNQCRVIRVCTFCGEEFTGRKRPYCPRCEFETRPCAFCDKPVTRSRATSGFRNTRWLCTKREQGRWLARLRTA